MLVHLLLLLCSTPTATAAETTRVATRQLPQRPGLYERWDPKRSYGTSQMIRIIEQVATEMAWRFPEADPLMIGDISRPGGGRMFGHITHDRGVDADIGLFQVDGRQPMGGFINLRPEQLDCKRTWALIAALIDTGEVHHILLDRSLIRRLRTYLLVELQRPLSEVNEVFPPVNEKVPWDRMGVVRHAPRHRNHMHVRVGRPQPKARPIEPKAP